MLADALHGSAGAGPFLAAAGLLLVSGIAKLRRPDAAADVLASFRVPGGRHAARAVGAAELGLAAWAIAAPDRAAAVAVCAAYALFAVVAAALVARTVPLASCGCLGETRTPPSVVHVLLNVACAGVAAVAVAAPPPALDELLPSLPLGGAPFVLGVLAATWLAVAVLAHLPQALAAYRPQRG
ncbi:MAG: hypothetical protein R3C15_05260 [Thermoleophilia bacterium]